MRTPEMYTVQERLAGGKDFTVVSALRGPDTPDDHILKSYTAAVIRYWVEGADCWGVVGALPFVVIRTIWNEDCHYEGHIRNAANAIGLPVVKLSKGYLEALPSPPQSTRSAGLYRLWMREWIKACYGEAGEERPEAPETDV
ncbi:hypothetical protein LCGC14_1262860 [marine sediment metagenome]|uniref:Uncharacterized protein n=1 Tax=marine sediment metagenome TaxID=412755 RepID=A0A0F9L2H1_9ZZZZ